MALIFLSPLTCWYGPLASLADHVEIRQLEDNEKAEFRKWAHVLSGREIEELTACSWWLFREWVPPPTFIPADEPNATEVLWNVLRILQMFAHVSDSLQVLGGFASSSKVNQFGV